MYSLSPHACTLCLYLLCLCLLQTVHTNLKRWCRDWGEKYDDRIKDFLFSKDTQPAVRSPHVIPHPRAVIPCNAFRHLYTVLCVKKHATSHFSWFRTWLRYQIDLQATRIEDIIDVSEVHTTKRSPPGSTHGLPSYVCTRGEKVEILHQAQVLLVEHPEYWHSRIIHIRFII